MDERKITINIIDVVLKCICIDKTNNYKITRANTFMIKNKDGSFTTYYPDNYGHDGKRYFFERLDRKKNLIVYREGQ